MLRRFREGSTFRNAGKELLGGDDEEDLDFQIVLVDTEAGGGPSMEPSGQASSFTPGDVDNVFREAAPEPCGGSRGRGAGPPYSAGFARYDEEEGGSCVTG